jgi:hypothetical protein
VGEAVGLFCPATLRASGIYGLPFRILMVAVKTVLMGIEVRRVPVNPTAILSGSASGNATSYRGYNGGPTTAG